MASAERHPRRPVLTAFTIAVAGGTADQIEPDTEADDARRAKELARQGHLLRLWTLPGQSSGPGLCRTRDPAEMQAILKSLPLDAWMTVETTPLTPHPSDPGLAAS